MAARGRPPASDHIINPNLILHRDELVEHLENITHRSLVEDTQGDILQWLARHGLIHNSYTCLNCNVPCRLNSYHHLNDGKQWRCPNCNFAKSIRANSLFRQQSYIFNANCGFYLLLVEEAFPYLYNRRNWYWRLAYCCGLGEFYSGYLWVLVCIKPSQWFQKLLLNSTLF